MSKGRDFDTVLGRGHFGAVDVEGR